MRGRDPPKISQLWEAEDDTTVRTSLQGLCAQPLKGSVSSEHGRRLHKVGPGKSFVYIPAPKNSIRIPGAIGEVRKSSFQMLVS